ncbi:MAG TPA: PAS domain S-box protein [Ktedonobacterales bacterium]|nr:PAS domain S-box protein [Ktedonobacterales bacterium]
MHGTAARDQRAPEEALERRGQELARLTAHVEQMTAVISHLQAANQELGSTNLELQRVNDELLLARKLEQASAEEIRTLNAELQASNEELETVNEELEATVEELRLSNDTLLVCTEEARALADTTAQQHRVSEAERARLMAILSSLGDAVLVVDPSGAPLLTNETYVRMFGDASAPFAAQDAEGYPLPPEATPQGRAARGETFLMEFTLDQDDGRHRYFEANGQPIRSLGEELGGVITVRDITERSLHHLQDEFLSLASHELRTPLTPLYSYLQLLEKHFAQEPAQRVSRSRRGPHTRLHHARSGAGAAAAPAGRRHARRAAPATRRIPPGVGACAVRAGGHSKRRSCAGNGRAGADN